MGKPPDTHTDKELVGALAEGELTDTRPPLPKFRAIKSRMAGSGAAQAALALVLFGPQALLAKTLR